MKFCYSHSNGASVTRKEALTILEVAETATREEIQRAYRTLARVWHPDRFPNDPELQRKAQDKLKQINAAYEILKSAAFAAGQATTSQPAPKQQPTPPPSPEPVPSQTPNPKSPQTATATKYGRFLKTSCSFAVGLLLFVGLVFIVVNEINQRQRGPQNKLIEPLKAVDKNFASPANEYTSPSSGMKFALIPAGEFRMGSSPADVQALRAPLYFQEEFKDEQPQHPVRITQPFYMGVYEVTQGEFQKMLGRNPSCFSKNGECKSKVSGLDTDRFPVEDVTWFDAIEFCNRLSEADGRTPYYGLTSLERDGLQSINKANVTIVGGKGYRLPTEAEWEYSCRANTTTPFHFGSVLNRDIANIDGTCLVVVSKPNEPIILKRTTTDSDRTTTVDDPKYLKNAFGLAQMHGNVCEWCEDVFDGNVYASRSGVTTNPLVANGSERRVLRGGHWSDDSSRARSAYRLDIYPGNHHSFSIGFRVVCWPSP